MAETFIPLFSSTVRSSLWSLSGDCIKVFLTLALEAGPDGLVSASVDGIRRIVDLPMPDVQRHLATLEATDPYSKDLERGGSGARLAKVPGGWRVVNMEWYRAEARKQAELFRKRKWWNEKGSAARRGARPTERETETDQISLSSPAREPEVTKVDPKRGRFAPPDFEPNDTNRVRCQELRFDPQELLRAFKLQEFNRDYSDWQRRFGKWIEEQKVRRETDRAKPSGRAAPKKHSQPDCGVTGFEKMEWK